MDFVLACACECIGHPVDGYDEEVGFFTKTQQMVIFPDGKCGVRKFRHMVTREVDGTVYLDGRHVR